MLVLNVAEQEDEVFALARLELDLDVMARDGAPAVGDAVGGAAGLDVLREGSRILKT